MISITILALDNALSSSVMGTMDIFCQAGVTYNYIMGKEQWPYFDVCIVTETGESVRGFNAVNISPHASALDIKKTDVIIISSFADFATLESNRKLLDWITCHYEKGAIIASICVGSFFLAETGLLDGKSATTHWGFADEFTRRYPEVELKPDQIITDEGRLLCSGACNSYIDLSVYLIERLCSKTTAIESSKAMIHDYGRNSQAPYCMLKHNKAHTDKEIKEIQERLEKNPASEFNPELTARQFGMSRRTFERRFKANTGYTPISYLHRVRVETSRIFLETSQMNFDEISYLVGYEDSNFFRKIFRKHTGLLPVEYRRKFQR
ncbi:MAG: helix-turn-helix domain-containing protein [Proteobacteria bacterium]|nr:helix-turn-helix domain-containing protein [Pseudomonadota bacterium]MBU1583893.1 helix-turn-helix domain-containing protein [Pseudomonadota bacterium]MBU2453402.1 helix-turn-helix domain-containing protein [Pseudomonadota bacterium]MBU2628026.1 helix-turn-helix domain-containing protein [Pseudomonadota bacterium]